MNRLPVALYGGLHGIDCEVRRRPDGEGAPNSLRDGNDADLHGDILTR